MWLLRTIILLLASVIVTEADNVDVVDCLPDAYAHSDLKKICQDRKCTFRTEGEEVQETAPLCYFPPDHGYVLESQSETANGWILNLIRSRNSGTLFGGDAERLLMFVEFETETRIRIKITDGSSRYQVPIPVNKREFDHDRSQQRLYDIRFRNSTIFSFQIVRQSTGTVLFDTGLPGLVFSDQFIQLPIRLASNYVYGLGENEQQSLKHDMNWQKWTGWARDSPPEGHANLYGVFPVITVLEPDQGNAHTIAILNSNLQEWEMIPSPGIVYRTTGGILDIFIFVGPTPEETYQQYTEAFGRYPIPPYWSLGHHLCKYGYVDTDDVRGAYERTVSASVPLDAQWVDIDIMHRFLDFTVNKSHFSDLPAFVDTIRQNGKRFVAIVDPGIDFENVDSDGTYLPYTLGQEMDVWIKRSDGKTPVVAKVWPFGNVHFPDFFKHRTVEWWKTCIKDFREKLKVDGIWIDMNEPSNFKDGDVESGCSKKNLLNRPPYIPPGLKNRKIEAQTICPDSTHEVEGMTMSHYDLHSLYGWSESRATFHAIREATGTRGFVLTRSSFIGSGRWAAKWLGDNTSLWSHLKESIIGILQFNMFGIPHIGADICGFSGTTTPELCVRWYQTGSFYPFTRNHNGLGNPNQDPGVFDPKFIDIIRTALRYRYKFLPILYTLFYQHQIQGSTVVRPLWNVFPKDLKTYDIDQQFMWGSQLLISPVLDSGATTKTLYLPKDSRWYDVSRFLSDGLVKEDVDRRGIISEFDAPLEIVPLHFRGGNIFPLQTDAGDTAHSRFNPFEFEIALDDDETASGILFYDDGESIDTVESGKYFLAEYRMTADGEIVGKIKKDGFSGMKTLFLEYVGVMGLKCETVTSVILNYTTNLERFYFEDGRLQIYDLHYPMNQNFVITIKKS